MARPSLHLQIAHSPVLRWVSSYFFHLDHALAVAGSRL